MCAGAILEARVQHVVYGATEPRSGAAGSVVNLFSQSALNHHTSVTSGVLAEDSADLLTRFFSSRRRMRQALAEPLREDALRTPAECFTTVDALFPESAYLRLAGEGAQWRLHFADAGPQNAAITVLLVHDVPGWGHQWKGLIPVLTDVGFRVLAPAVIGFGRVDQPKKKQGHSAGLHFQSLDAIASLVQSDSRIVVIGQGTGLQLADCWALQSVAAVAEVLGVDPSPDLELDVCPHPNRGFMAGLNFFAGWPISAKHGKQHTVHSLGAPQSILQHMNKTLKMYLSLNNHQIIDNNVLDYHFGFQIL